MKHLNKFLLLLVVACCSLTLTSCLGDDDDKEKSCMEELNELAMENYQMTMAFSKEPTAANCEAMKETATNFFNKAKQCGDADMIYAAEQNLNAINEWNCAEL